MLDGIDNNSYGTSNQGFSYQVIQAAPDAVQEIRVDTNNYSAEYGRAGGAVINAVVRSGTNQFHGSAWDFLRNTVLNATGFFKPLGGVKPPLVQNQFGAAFGGPILKGKMFFFADYEGIRSVSRTLSYLSLPTSAQRAGNFGVPILNPYTGVTYSDGVIPASAITAFGQKVLNELPALNLPGATSNFQAFPRTQNQSDKGDIRIDYHLTDKLTLFGRHSHRLSTSDSAPSMPGPSGSGDTINRIYNQQIAVGATWIVSPRSLLDVRFGLTRTQGEDLRQREIDNTPSMLDMYGISGLPTTKPIAGGLNRQAINGYTAFGRDSGQHQNPYVYNPKVSFSRTTGRHMIKVGLEYQAINTEILDANPLYGTDTYAGQFSRPPAIWRIPPSGPLAAPSRLARSRWR